MSFITDDISSISRLLGAILGNVLQIIGAFGLVLPLALLCVWAFLQERPARLEWTYPPPSLLYPVYFFLLGEFVVIAFINVFASQPTLSRNPITSEVLTWIITCGVVFVRVVCVLVNSACSAGRIKKVPKAANDQDLEAVLHDSDDDADDVEMDEGLGKGHQHQTESMTNTG